MCAALCLMCAAYAVRRQELSSLEKFPRLDRGLGGVRIEDSLNR
ncbi:hypothetical protein A2U01_0082333, partial [Trifolium medium]|nr:hypothetical protein [Trifolium medium]